VQKNFNIFKSSSNIIDIQNISKKDIKIDRKWSMPNKNTFLIKPIEELLIEEVDYTDNKIIIDPFANNNKWGTITNDLNPEYNTNYHLDALDFLKLFDNNSVDIILYDPPYSSRQIAESYHQFGIKVTQETTQSSFYTKIKKEISRICKLYSRVISFGWNTNGIGKKLGFHTYRILIVDHGSNHNSTLVTCEIKINEGSIDD
jgi:hypothetical protein